VTSLSTAPSKTPRGAMRDFSWCEQRPVSAHTSRSPVCQRPRRFATGCSSAKQTWRPRTTTSTAARISSPSSPLLSPSCAPRSKSYWPRSPAPGYGTARDYSRTDYRRRRLRRPPRRRSQGRPSPCARRRGRRSDHRRRRRRGRGCGPRRARRRRRWSRAGRRRRCRRPGRRRAAR